MLMRPIFLLVRRNFHDICLLYYTEAPIREGYTQICHDVNACKLSSPNKVGRTIPRSHVGEANRTCTILSINSPDDVRQ